MNFELKIGSSVLAMTLMTTPAVAQDSQPQLDSDDSAIASTDIVVTAQRRTERLQDVPVSVSAVSGETVEELNLRTPAELFTQIPNVRTQFPQGNQGLPIFNIRGVTLLDFGDTSESSIAVYVDDVYLGQTSVQNGGLFDLERVEVLRGPQGTLYGRNATGGLVNFITRKPTSEMDGYMLLGYGSDSETTIEGAISGPVSDNVRARFAGRFNRRDGWQKNLAVPGSSYGSVGHNIAVRATVEADLSSAVTLSASGHYNDYKGQEAGAALFGAKVPGSAPAVRCSDDDIRASLCTNAGGFRDPNPNPKEVYGDLVKQPQSVNAYGGWLKLTAELGFANLTSLSSFDHAEKRQRWDSDRSPTPSLDFETAVRHSQWSQELRLDGETGPVKWLVGGYYYGDKRLFTGTLRQLGGLGSWADQKIRTVGAFSQLTFAVTDTFNLTGGLRYIDDKRELVRLVRVGSGGAPLQRVGTPSVFNGQPFDISRESKDSKVTWRAAFDWHFTPENMVYGSVSTGYKSAGFNANLPAPDFNLVLPTAPETITSYEVGLKGEALDRRISYNIAAFYMKYKDFQAQGTIIPDPAVSQTPVSILFNVGDASIKGLEAELRARPIDDLTISLGAGLLDTKISSTAVFNGTPLDGNNLALAPKYSFNGTVRYAPRLEGFGTPSVTAVFFYQDDVFMGPDNIGTEREPGYGVIDLHLGWTSLNDKLSIDLFSKNITNTKYFVHHVDTGGATHLTSIWGRPRTYGIQATLKM